MITPVELFIGLRYLRAKRRTRFVSFITLISLIGIALGVISFGLRVVRTIGQRITRLTPSRAFAVALASTATVVVASGLGLPVSTTHTLVGAVLGVGLVSGSRAIDFPIIRTIVGAWLVTLPVDE